MKHFYLILFLLISCGTGPNVIEFSEDVPEEPNYTGKICVGTLVDPTLGRRWAQVSFKDGQTPEDFDDIVFAIYAKCGIRDWEEARNEEDTFEVVYFRYGDSLIIHLPDDFAHLQAYLVQNNFKVLKIE